MIKRIRDFLLTLGAVMVLTGCDTLNRTVIAGEPGSIHYCVTFMETRVACVLGDRESARQDSESSQDSQDSQENGS